MRQSPFGANTENHSYVIISPEKKIAYISAAAKKILGLTVGDFIASGVNSIQDYLFHALALFELCPIPEPYNGTFIHEHEGEQDIYDLEIDHLEIESSPFYIMRLSNRNWLDSINRINRSLDLANVGLLELDARLNCRYVNEGWETLVGQEFNDSKGRGWTFCFPDQDRVDILQLILRNQNFNRSSEFTAPVISPIGQLLYTRWFLQFDIDSRNRLRGVTAMVFDITEETLKSKEAEELAHYDSLTGLLNRSFFQGQLRSMANLCMREGDMALMYIDLDGFKQVNDNFGHEAGDRVLIQVAQRLRKTLRKGDVVARLGGDEFAVLALNLNDYRANGEQIAKNIIREMAYPFTLQLRGEATLVRLSASIGISGLVSELQEFSGVSDADSVIQQMMTHADLAMYQAKSEGKSKACFYTESLDNQAKRDSVIRTRLYECLDRKELELEFQPIIEASSGRAVGSEALLRWRNTACDNVSVQLLIKMLESSALCLDFGREVVTQSLRYLRVITDDPSIASNHYISINLSPLQIKDSDFVNWCIAEIEQSRLPGHLIQLEVTESIFLDATGPVKANLRALRDRGVKIALDDFGTGYSSLSYLERFPIDCIKIDKSMTDRIGTKKGKAVVRAVLLMSEELSIETIVEGVETAEQLQELITLGSDLIQGYYYSRPLQKEAHLNYIRKTQYPALNHPIAGAVNC